MLDGVARRLLGPALDRAGQRLAARGWRPDAVTLVGAFLAVVCGMAIAAGWLWLALLVLALNRLCDGLDGAIARTSGLTDFGGYLDIVCDFIFYAAVPLGFALSAPDRAAPAAVLLAAFYLNGASFLGYAVLAARHGLTTDVRGRKSLYFTAGLMEGTETIAFFVAMLLWPAAFNGLALTFAALCIVTFLARIRQARLAFAAKERA